MEFIVDKVSEDSFYENLLLGLPKILEDIPNITEPYLNRSPPVPNNIISAWEQKNNVLLPEDLRSFYGSTNGFLYSYEYFFKEETDENKLLCKIEINPIESLNPITEYEQHPNPEVNLNGDRYALKLGAESRVFELVDLEGAGKLALVYINSRFFPNIWILTESEFYFLADDFVSYMRMCIHHMGIPFWQFAYTTKGVPRCTEMLFRLLIPSALPLDKKIEDIRKQYESTKTDDDSDLPVNKIDLKIFKNFHKTANYGPTQEIVSQQKKESKTKGNVAQSKKAIKK